VSYIWRNVRSLSVSCAGFGIVGVVLALASPPGHRAMAQAITPPPAGAPSDVPPERLVHVKVPSAAEDRGFPFQMGFEFTQFLAEEGSLAYPHQSARSLGLHFVFREGRAVRQHFAFAHHWEKSGDVTRQGFRLDLLSLGFPILVWDRGIRLEIEPVLRPIRGQILFEETPTNGVRDSHSLVRFESGFALGLRATKGAWFMTFEPLSIDFRTIVATRSETRTGFSRIWSMAYTLGRDF
jgi:hypothetical protein